MTRCRIFGVDPVYANGKLLHGEPAALASLSCKNLLRRVWDFSSCALTNSVPRLTRLVHARLFRRVPKRMAPSNIPAPESLLIPNVNYFAAA